MITVADLVAQMVVIEICSLIGFQWIKNFPSVKRIATNCRDGNGDKNPGRMYCSGDLELKQFEEVKENRLTISGG